MQRIGNKEIHEFLGKEDNKDKGSNKGDKGNVKENKENFVNGKDP